MEWFVLKNGDVLGPYETNSVAQMFGSEADVLIWGVPHQEWLSFSDWARKMNMGAVVHQSSSFKRGQTQTHTPSPQAEHHPVSTPSSHSHPPQQVIITPNETAAPHAHGDVSAHHKDEIQSHSEAVIARDVHSAPVSPVTSTPTVGESSAMGSSYDVTDSAPAGSSDFNPDATAVYVHSDEEEASDPSHLFDDDGRTVVSAVDLPLEIPAEDDVDVDNVIPLHQDQVEPEMSHVETAQTTASAVNTVEQVKELLHEAQDQLQAEPEPVETPEAAVKPKYDDEQGTVDIEELLVDQPHEDELERTDDVVLYSADEDDDGEGATRVSASLDLSAEDKLDLHAGSEDLAAILGDAMIPQSSTQEESSHFGEDLAEDLSDHEAQAQDDESLDLSFDGQTQVSESAMDIASLLDSDVQAREQEESEDYNFEFEGESQVSEDATRVESLLDLEGVPSAESSVDEEVGSLEWDGVGAEEEATRVQMEDLDFPVSEDENEARLEALLGEEDDADEGSTRVSASLDLESKLADLDEGEEGATRVSTSTDYNLDDTEDDEEGATRVNASLDDGDHNLVVEISANENSVSDSDDDAYVLELEAEEEEATRVNASESSVEEDLSEFEEEITRDVPLSLVDDSDEAEEESTRVSASEKNQDDSHDLEGATRVEDLKVIAQKMNEEKLMQEDFVWYLAYEGESEGPLTLSQVLKSIDDYEVKDFVYLWREGFIDWKNLFDVPELSSGLGIGFRRHARVQSSGTVSVEFEGGIQIGQLDNLSESGIGLTGIDGLHLGDVVKVKLDADDLDEEVMLVARVRFVSETGLLGLSYEKDKYPENVTKVIDFVKSKAEKAAA